MILVDTGAWIALSDRRDQHHSDAVLVYNKLRQRKEPLLTTDYLLDETVTRLRYDLGHSTAVRFLDFIQRIENTGVLSVLYLDKVLFEEAVTLFRQFNSAKLSFTDCTSFAVCQKHGISETFAFDQHFLMLGITLLG